jgi:hypothetical protein
MNTFKNFGKMALKSLMLFSLAAVLLTACKKDNFDTTNPDAAALNIVNASPGPLAINFYLDNNFVSGPALSFGNQSGYILAFTGSRRLDISSGGTNVSILADTLDLAKDKYYSVFVVGQNSSLSTVVTEDNTADPASGKVKIRFLQLSPDAGSLSLGIEGGAQLFANQEYKTSSGFTEIDPGTFTLEIRNSENAVSEKEVTLTAGNIYTVWSGGLISGSGTTAIGIAVTVN